MASGGLPLYVGNKEIDNAQSISVRAAFHYTAGTVKSSLGASSLYSPSIHRVSIGMKEHFSFSILVSCVPYIYKDIIFMSSKVSIKLNVILLPSCYKNEFLTLDIISKPKCDELSESLPSLLALQFSLDHIYTLLQFINYTYQEIWRYVTLTLCSMSPQDLLLLQRQPYVLVLMTGGFCVAEFKPSSVDKIWLHLYLFIFAVVPCSYASEGWTACDKVWEWSNFQENTNTFSKAVVSI